MNIFMMLFIGEIQPSQIILVFKYLIQTKKKFNYGIFVKLITGLFNVCLCVCVYVYIYQYSKFNYKLHTN